MKEDLGQIIEDIAKNSKAIRQDVCEINHKLTHFLQNYREDYMSYQRNLNEYRP